MKFKYHLIRFLLIFLCLLVPAVITNALKFYGYSSGLLGTIIIYGPFTYLFFRILSGKIGPKPPPKPTDDSVPITPEMLAADAADIDDALSQSEDSPHAPKHEDTAQPSKDNTAYYVETPDGMIVRVPADKLDAWMAADHDAPLTPAEERLKKAILNELLGSGPDKEPEPQGPSPSVSQEDAPEDSADKILNMLSQMSDRLDQMDVRLRQMEASQGPKQPASTSAEKPAKKAPARRSYYADRAPIPFWRNSRFLAWIILGLMALALPVTIIYVLVTRPSTRPSSAVGADDENRMQQIEERLEKMRQDAIESQEYIKRVQEQEQARMAAATPASLPIPRSKPHSGEIFYKNPLYNSWNCSVIIDASSLPLTDGFYIKLRRYESKATTIAFYVRGGTKSSVDVPAGLFELLYASGSEWYGEELLFGSDTNYYFAGELLAFFDDGETATVRTVTLDKQYNSNLDMEEISAAEFGIN